MRLGTGLVQYVVFTNFEVVMKRTYTVQFYLNLVKLEEMFLDELRKQNWLSISVSNVLGEELFISLQ